ncbi:MAG: hypothetical protein WC473_03695 [Patescibacteria group bacterium]
MHSRAGIMRITTAEAAEAGTEGELTEAIVDDCQEIAVVNPEAVEKLAVYLKSLPPDGDLLNFYSFYNAQGEEIIASGMYPPLNHPATVDFFFYVCSQQFGFWYGDCDGYSEPLWGTLNGKRIKGSGLLWQLAKKALDNDPNFFKPINLASLSPDGFVKFLSDDNGPVPFPDWEIRYILTTAYGRSFFKLPRVFETPLDIIEQHPKLLEFVNFLTLNVSGFSDPFTKKAMLLAMALANRPEHFFKINPDSPQWRPIVDYHLMRLALRFGLVDLDDRWVDRISCRSWVDSTTERAIRLAVYDAVERVIDFSGRSMAEVDKFMWSARKYCPEEESPQCNKCLLEGICQQRTELFQPVLRTTAY